MVATVKLVECWVCHRMIPIEPGSSLGGEQPCAHWRMTGAQRCLAGGLKRSLPLEGDWLDWLDLPEDPPTPARAPEPAYCSCSYFGGSIGGADGWCDVHGKDPRY